MPAFVEDYRGTVETTAMGCCGPGRGKQRHADRNPEEINLRDWEAFISRSSGSGGGGWLPRATYPTDSRTAADSVYVHGQIRQVDEPFIAFKEQIEDPENNPFPTLSGKIEIYCEHIAELNVPNMPPIPKYLSHEEHYDAPKATQYPLQLLTPHNKRRTHSSLRRHGITS